MDWYVVKHVSRELWATQNMMTDRDGVRSVVVDRPWCASEENPYLVWTEDEAKEIRNEMEVSDDWRVVNVRMVEVEITEN